MIWPPIWRMVVRFTMRRLFPNAASRRDCGLVGEREEAGKWCRSRAVTIRKLAPKLPFQFVPVDLEETFAELFRIARERVKSCPMRLGGAGNLDLLYALARGSGARCIVETGVAYGWSSLALLLAIDGRDNARLYSVDLPYLTFQNDDWVGIAVPRTLLTRWRLFRMADREGLPWALRAAGRVDLAHYDSDKSPEGRAFGYRAIWRRLRPGGILVSDDIGDNLAFKRFAETVGRTPVIVSWSGKYQGILIR